jgi:AAT family amino acid transporter
MSEKRNVEISEQTLNRGIQPWHVSLIALGGIIGSCYFLGLGLTFHDMGAGATLIAYALAGLTIYGVMQSFAELLVNIPRRGSFVSYTRQFMGDTASAGIGWAFWANWVCYIPSEALAVATFSNVLFFNGEASTITLFIIGVITLALLTLINVYQVTWFGHVESIMAILKILAIILFVIAGIVIWMGLFNHGASLTNELGETFTISAGFIGMGAMLAETGKSAFEQLFPSGGIIIITMMIWTLVNFQGSEIVGLSAAETQNPEVSVPKACRSVAYRIIMIYLIPIFILSLIMPYFAATLEDSVFAQALIAYGFGWGAKLFEIVTLIAAFSCANSGFYGTVRALYGLSTEGLAPKFLSKLNKFSTPQNATIFSLVFVWVVFLLSFLIVELGLMGGEDNSMYVALIGIAGFTGTLCWVGIILSQIIFRKKLVERGYEPQQVLSVKAAWFPGLAYFSIVLQTLAMLLLVFEEGDGISIFLLSMDIIVVPIVVFQIQKTRGKIRPNIIIGEDEVLFDDKFPIKPGSKAEELKKLQDAKPVVVKPTGGLSAASIITTIVSVVLSLYTISIYPSEFADGNVFTADGMPKVWIFTIICIALYGITFLLVKKIGEYSKYK